jgi:uncharacterized membrane protein YsdA (DUF1294 family)
MELSPQQFIFLAYLSAVNLITFFIYLVDKQKSVNGSRRISEKMLWFLALIGGSIGSLFAMHVFRHKTKKLFFQTILAVIILAQVWLVMWLWK